MNLRSFSTKVSTCTLTPGLLVVLFFSGCARKQRDPFVFAPTTAVEKIHTLALPCVQGISALRTPAHTIISWQPVTQHPTGLTCTGYAVYTVSCDYRISKKPIGQVPYDQTSYIDNKTAASGYLVRILYRKGTANAHGPASNIARPRAEI